MLSFSLFIAPILSVLSGSALVPLLILLAFGLLLQSKKVEGQNKDYWEIVKADEITKLAIAFFCWALLTCPLSINPGVSTSYWVRTVVLVFIGFYACSVVFRSRQSEFKSGSLGVLVVGFIFALVLAAVEAQHQGWAIPAFRSLVSSNGRSVFLMDDLNRSMTFLAVLIWPVLAAWIMLLQAKSRRKRIILVTIFLGLSAFVISEMQSTSAIIGLAAGAIAFILLLISAQFFRPLLLAGIIAGVLAVPIASQFIDSVVLRDARGEVPASGLHRLYIWQFAGKKAREHPVMGWGFHASRYIPGGKEKVVDVGQGMRERMPSHPHNGALQIWLETGLVGLLIFLGLVTVAARRILWSEWNPVFRAAAFASFAGYLSIGMLSYDLFRDWWIAAGLWVAVAFQFIAVKALARAQN